MRVLSLTEPYATLIKQGCKTIETRSWATKYRGKLYLHASSTRIPKEFRQNRPLMKLVNLDELNFGRIICSCDLLDCIKMTDEFIAKVKQNQIEYLCGIYARDRYAWILGNIQVLKHPIAAKGHLGLWSLKLTENLE